MNNVLTSCFLFFLVGNCIFWKCAIACILTKLITFDHVLADELTLFVMWIFTMIAAVGVPYYLTYLFTLTIFIVNVACLFLTFSVFGNGGALKINRTKR